MNSLSSASPIGPSFAFFFSLLVPLPPPPHLPAVPPHCSLAFQRFAVRTDHNLKQWAARGKDLGEDAAERGRYVRKEIPLLPWMTLPRGPSSSYHIASPNLVLMNCSIFYRVFAEELKKGMANTPPPKKPGR